MKDIQNNINNKQPLPLDFLKDFENYFGKDFLLKYQNEYQNMPIRGLRINNKYIDTNCFEKIFSYPISKIIFFNNAFYLDTDQKLGNTALHHAGAFYLQEPSSMIPVASVQNLDFNNKIVLDLCASPGGKTTQIASLMQNGILLSNEIDFKRCQTLFSNIERLGLKNVILTNESPQNLAKVLQKKCDYIFVDAPCSGEGMFRKDETSVKMWNSNLKYTRSELQLEILDFAHQMLKQNGILIYSTCTYNLIENENVVDTFTNKYNYSILSPTKLVEDVTYSGICVNSNNELTKTKHFLPFISKGEGQFVAVLQKNGEDEAPVTKQKSTTTLNVTETKIVEDFLKNVLNVECLNGVFYEKINNNINIIKSSNISLKSLKTLCKGVIVGEIKKDMLFPHHQFFSAYGDNFKSYFNLNFDNEIISKYIAGEQLFLDEVIKNSLDYNLQKTKYAVIKVNGVSLGGVKIVDNCLKNLYPKGLRAKINK